MTTERTAAQSGPVPRQHPYRSQIDAEIHARPVVQLGGGQRIRRAAFMAETADAPIAPLRAAFLGKYGRDGDGDARQLEYESGGYRVTAEFHNEFLTLTWIGALDDWTAWPEAIGLELLATMSCIAATRIDLVDAPEISAAALAGFNPQSLCYSALYGGAASAATDFVVDAHGFTRFEIAGGKSGDLRRGVLVRRLLEIETYRSLVLLGLPLARAQAPAVQAHEEKLGALMRDVGQGTSMADNRRDLDLLHQLSLEVERTRNATSFRFAATRAYAEVLHTRITRLGEVSIDEFTTIARYLENRIDPAVATCRALEKRLDVLAGKLERSAALLNASISLGMEVQNQAVLDSISETGRNQYRLQRTVEGLSIIAISYYGLALLSEVLDGISPMLHFDKGPVVSISAPIVILIVWLLLRRVNHD